MPRTVARISCLWLSSLALSSCVLAPSPPYEDYTIARAAVQAAQDVDSARYSTGLWNRADESYRMGKRAYSNNDFGQAKIYFDKAITYAERAEDATRLKKFENGDGFP